MVFSIGVLIILLTVPIVYYVYSHQSQKNHGQNTTASTDFLLLEIWHSTEGYLLSGNRSDIDFLCIDFPLYGINASSQTVVDYWHHANQTDISKLSVLYGRGSSLGGVIGGGAGSDLTFYNATPIIISVDAYLNDSKRFTYTVTINETRHVFLNDTIMINPGDEYNWYYNHTKKYGENTTVEIKEVIKIKNYGIWPISSLVFRG